MSPSFSFLPSPHSMSQPSQDHQLEPFSLNMGPSTFYLLQASMAACSAQTLVLQIQHYCILDSRTVMCDFRCLCFCLIEVMLQRYYSCKTKYVFSKHICFLIGKKNIYQHKLRIVRIEHGEGHERNTVVCRRTPVTRIRLSGSF